MGWTPMAAQNERERTRETEVGQLTRIQIVVALQSCDLFSYCRAEEILRIAGIAQALQRESVDAGEVCFVEKLEVLAASSEDLLDEFGVARPFLL